jgi:hypothetical protein
MVWGVFIVLTPIEGIFGPVFTPHLKRKTAKYK